MRNRTLNCRICELMYIHRGINSRIVRFKNSLDEVVRILNARR